MSKIIGARRVRFKGKSGSDVEGYNLWVSDVLMNGVGVYVERIFLTDELFDKAFPSMDLPEVLDLDVRVYYNRYGKVEDLRIL